MSGRFPDLSTRCSLCRYGCPAAIDDDHKTIEENRGNVRKSHRQLYVLDQLLLGRSALGRSPLLLCLAGQIWQRQQDVSVVRIATRFHLHT